MRALGERTCDLENGIVAIVFGQPRTVPTDKAAAAEPRKRRECCRRDIEELPCCNAKSPRRRTSQLWHARQFLLLRLLRSHRL